MLPRETIIMMKSGIPETEKWNNQEFHNFLAIFRWFLIITGKIFLIFRLHLNQPLISSWNKVWCVVSEYFYCWQSTFNHVRNNNMDFKVVVTIIAVRFKFLFFTLKKLLYIYTYLPTFCNLWGRYYTYLHTYIFLTYSRVFFFNM